MKPTALTDVIHPPSDPKTRILRYMDFTKFVAMLEHQGLFFCRCSKFADPFEGSYPRGNKSVREEELVGLGLTLDQIRDRLATREAFYKWERHWVLANCWHMGSSESDALWRLYSNTNGICIESTYQQLRDCMAPEILIGAVTYLDYDNETLEEGNSMFPFVHKRRAFEHERELRAIYSEPWPRSAGGGIDISYIPRDYGRWVGCDLGRIIQSVLVAPDSRNWFHELICRVAARYELPAEIRQSSLASAPFF